MSISDNASASPKTSSRDDRLEEDDLAKLFQHEIGNDIQTVASRVLLEGEDDSEPGISKEEAQEAYNDISDLYSRYMASIKGESEESAEKVMDELWELRDHVPEEYRNDYENCLRVSEGFSDVRDLMDGRTSSSPVEEILIPWEGSAGVETNISYLGDSESEEIEAGLGLRSAVNTFLTNSRNHGYREGQEERRFDITVEDLGSSIELIFEDNGKGWQYENPEEALEKDEGEGTGIGLYHVNNLVEEVYGGELDLGESRYGGAQVSLNIPKVQQTRDEKVPAVSAAD
ncbi:MAG: ATP-binding protein [Candidatus Nanohaloarchaea archaeon]